jgi:hypothetical protein
MYPNLRGKLKPCLWDRPVCTDTSEMRRLRQKAKRDFEKTYREEEGTADVASADALGEAFEETEPYGLDDPDA